MHPELVNNNFAPCYYALSCWSTALNWTAEEENIDPDTVSETSLLQIARIYCKKNTSTFCSIFSIRCIAFRRGDAATLEVFRKHRPFNQIETLFHLRGVIHYNQVALI
jgi:hypothetical protein